ncbi:MAG: NAD(P)H-quinone oxidoreductase [Burkholderiales bacterium]|jgi:NADPH:quinone reductase|nr:NAD(P)H-quinone oxidoreductase [Burkholderiales bacterium]
MTASTAALPAHFDCIEITTPGKPEVLQPARRPMPVPAAGEVLIAVHAAGVNRPDVLQRMGRYPVPPGASDLPGLEVAGVIAAVAADVTRWKVGDRVCALTNGGGYATYCLAPAGSVLPVPAGLSMIEAAAVPETFFTVWSNVFDRGQLAAGESFMVQGGSSGIGTTAIQIAAARGHTVFATAGSDEKCAACEKIGATRAINYRTEDFESVVKEATGGRGVDVILDMVGGDYVGKELKSLADGGRLVFIAFLGGMKATVDLNELMRRRLTMTGSTLRPRDNAFKAAVAGSLEREVWPLIAAGKVKPVIHATFPLAKAGEAHALMETSAHIGKIVLEVA